MIVERIRVKNFLSHADTVVDFTDAPLWLICGENGAGKSALFDALEYALYGTHRGGVQHHGLLVKQGEERGLVEVTVRLGGRRLRITQHLDATKGNLGGELAEWRDGVGWQIRNPGDGARAIWQWLGRYLPPADLFHSAVFLRQGRTAHFLSGTPRNRLERFAALLDLGRYSEVAERARVRAATARDRRQAATASLGALGDITDAAAQALRERREEAVRAVEAASGRLAEATVIREGAERWARLQATRGELVSRRADAEALLADEAAIRAAATRVAAWDRAAADLDRYWEKRGCAAALSAAAARADGEAAGIAATQSRRRAERDADDAQLGSIERDCLPAARAQHTAAHERSVALHLEAEIAAAREAAERAGADVARLAGKDGEFAAWQSRRGALGMLQLVATRAAERQVAAAQIAPREAALAAARARREAAHDVDLAAQAAAKAARDDDAVLTEEKHCLAVDAAQLKGKVERHGTLAGDERECPVCGQALDEAARNRVHETLAAERAQLAELESAIARTADAQAVAGQEVTVAERRAAEARDARERADGEVRGAEQALKQVRDDLTRAEASLLDAHTVAARQHPEYAASLDAVTTAWVATESARVEDGLRTAEAEARAFAEACKTETEKTTVLNTLRTRRLPEAEPLGDGAAAAVVRREARAAAELLRSCEAEVARLEDEAGAIRNRLSAAAAELADLGAQVARLNERAAQARRDAASAETAAAELAERLGPNWAAAVADRAACEVERVAVDALRTDAARLHQLDEARGQIRLLDEQLREADAALEAIDPRHREPVEDAWAREDAAGKAKGAAAACLQALIAELADLEARRARAAEYRRAADEAGAEAAAYGELFELLRDGGPLQNEIVCTEQERIVGEVNAVLARLGDRLRVDLGEPRRASGGMQIKDMRVVDTGDPAARPRFFEFLSGGEQFRVALALALALHRRVGGGIAGTIIVDEGFGMLDGDRRDELARQITDTSEGFLRLGLAENIIICSHSGEVQRYFPDRWVIRKRGGTASAERPDGEETAA